MKKLSVKKLGTLATAIALIATVGTVGITQINSKANERLKARYQGQTRYLTAISVAEKLMDTKYDNAVLSYGYDFPDALSGSVLASKVNAPILLVDKSVNGSKATLDFVKKNVNTSGTIYILGGDGVVRDEIIQDLKKAGYGNIKRLGGLNRYETNLLINNELNVPKGTPITIASGLGFADAISISGVAGANQMPIYLVGNSISQNTLNKIKEIQPSAIYIAGGTGAVNTNIENSLRSISGNIVRFDGATRFETSLKIANYFNKDAESVLVANAYDFPDALSGSVLATKVNAPVLLVPAKGDVSKQKDFVNSTNIKEVIAIGGEDVVSNQVVNDLAEQKPTTPPVVTPPVTTPPVVTPPTTNLPVVSVPTEMEQYLPSIGLEFKRKEEGLIDYHMNNQLIVTMRENNSRVTLMIDSNANQDTLKSVKQVLGMLLKTSSDEVYNIIINPSFATQTIQRDGKTIDIKNNGTSYTIVIKY